ncbi:MAG: UDP-N-acetylmuramoyl-L-alanine--D-glutamate ligase [Alphaproteobacteria bacterium]|nr:UDP-N-acetylmuramoyl-L-alanine--D-glutamate ligase [Alphaproteobacteria bacterium]
MIDLSSPKNIVIIGYGISGKSAYKFLTSKSHQVFVIDDDNYVEVAIKLSDVDWSNIDLVVKSPAVPFMPHNCHQAIVKANELNIPVVSTFDIFMLYNPDAKIIGITGTNGKSTTSSLIYHILKKSGISVELGGNIGIPYFELKKADWYVFEMSSYEIASSKYLKFEISCILNIEPDHLNLHGGFEHYVKAKHKLLEHSNEIIISEDDINTYNKFKNNSNALKISYSDSDNVDLYIFENTIYDKEYNRIVLDVACLSNLRGKHNQQNIAFAYAVCKKLKLSVAQIQKHIGTFETLPHRIKEIRKIKNIVFVNDSKATNPASAARALETFVGYNIFWIVGGRSKKTDPLVSVGPHLKCVQKIFLYGESEAEFESIFKGIKQTVKCKTLENATHYAYKDASKQIGPVVVLLSPMCSSYDQYHDFEERGRDFERIVKNIQA